MFIQDITPKNVDVYKAAKMQAKHQFDKGYSPKTINNHLAVLHRLFEKAIEYGTVVGSVDGGSETEVVVTETQMSSLARFIQLLRGAGTARGLPDGAHGRAQAVEPGCEHRGHQ
jgi:hypothetical protein